MWGIILIWSVPLKCTWLFHTLLQLHSVFLKFYFILLKNRTKCIYVFKNQWRSKHRAQTCGHSGGRRGWKSWENSMDHIATCEIDSMWGFAVWHRELDPVLGENLERWGGGGAMRGRGRMYTCGWFMLMYGRGQHNIIKQFSSN